MKTQLSTRENALLALQTLDREGLTSEQIMRARARLDLMSFVLYTKAEYKIGWFNQLLARRLDRFLQAIVRGESPRMIIMAPPRSGKTEMVSRRFPAYVLGRYPNMPIIATSHASELASSINRDVQRVIDNDTYRNVFPNTTLWGSNIRTATEKNYLRNSDAFEIVGHTGIYKSAGIGASITGRGGSILLIDDPIADAAEAHSDVVRMGIWEWYTTTLYTRGEPGAGILLIMTRWHEDDLAGRLISSAKKGGEQWEILRFPAVAETDEFDEDGTLLRCEGEPLHADRFSLERLERIKLGTEDTPGVGSRTWASLYQQRPGAAEGNIFKRENWEYIKLDSRFFIMAVIERKRYMREVLGVSKLIQAWDTAIGAKKKNDYAACTTLGVTRNKYIVFEVWKDKIKYPDLRREIQTRFDAWIPDVVVVEGGGAGAGKAVVQDLQRDSRLPLKEVPTVKDKEFRADIISPTQEGRRCCIPEGVGWASAFVDSAASFPSAKNDDDLDSWMLAMEYATSGPKAMQISDQAMAALGVR